MGRLVGIDLGTTNSVVAIVDSTRPRVLDNREAKTQTRSIVSLKKRKTGDPEILVGEVAAENWPTAPRDTIVSVKRLMGRAFTDTHVQRVRGSAQYEVVEPSDGTRDSVRVRMGGHEYSPVDISAMILKKLKDDAEFRLDGQPVTHAVITVPAYFSQIQRAATRRAALQAGLKVIKLLDEPTAAAVAYGVEAGSDDAKTLLVYDLGGGTFDVSVLMWAGSVFAPLNLEGDMWLGGDDFDQVLVEHALKAIVADCRRAGFDPRANNRFMVNLKKAAQAAKERLSSSSSTDIIMQTSLPNGDVLDVEVEITRDEFERLITPLVDRTMTIVETAIHKAELDESRIDCVLMAGNSTNVPFVQRKVEEKFGRAKVRRTDNPKHSVALGAAMIAARVRGLVCQSPDPQDAKRECGHVNDPEATVCEKCGAPLALADLAPAAATGDAGKGAADGAMVGVHDFGPIAISISGIAPFHYGTRTPPDHFNVFIREGDTYPTEKPEPQVFYTRVPNQRMVSIPVYGGPHLEAASLNTKQGEAFALLPPNLPKDTPVHVKLWLDANQIFKLSAHLADGTDLHPWITEGEADAKTVSVLETIDQKLAEIQPKLTPLLRQTIDADRGAVGDLLQRGDFQGALARVEALRERIEQIGDGPDEEEPDEDGIVGFAQFVINQYQWALPPTQARRIATLAQEAMQAVPAGDPVARKAKLHELKVAVDNLPSIIRDLLGLRSVLMGPIRQTEPARTQQLLEELDRVEAAWEQRNPAASQITMDLVRKVEQELKKLPPRGVQRCSHGHQVPPDTRFCPGKKPDGTPCGDDMWNLIAGHDGGSFGRNRTR